MYSVSIWEPQRSPAVGIKLNSTPGAAENWHLKEGMLTVKHYTYTMLFKHTFNYLLTAGVRILEKIVSIVFERNKSSMFLISVLNTSYVQDFMWGKKKVIVLASPNFEFYYTTVCIYLKKKICPQV